MCEWAEVGRSFSCTDKGKRVVRGVWISNFLVIGFSRNYVV